MPAFKFDASNVAPMEVRDDSVIPPGDYKAIITDTELRTSAKGDQYINLTLKIIEGQHEGRRIWDIAMLEGNPTAVTMGQKRISALCAATGRTTLSSTEELHDFPLLIKVGIQKGRTDANGNSWPEKNQIKGYLPLPSAQAPAPAARTAQPAAPAGQPWL